MKRYVGARVHSDEVYLASEVDEVIMNMVDEFAETAKEYESDRAKDKEEIARLRKALLNHRADLHCYSSRPCPTCRESAEVLGISNKVPYSCAREDWDHKALAEKEKTEPGSLKND